MLQIADEEQIKCVTESSIIFKSIISTLPHRHKAPTSPLSDIHIHGRVLMQRAHTHNGEYVCIMCDKKGGYIVEKTG